MISISNLLMLFVLLIHLKEFSCKVKYPSDIEVCLASRLTRLKNPITDFQNAYDLWSKYIFDSNVSDTGRNTVFPLSGAHDECGTISDNFASIIGGNVAPEYAWPWQGLVETLTARCGGTLIAKQWVLTAAHCLGTQSRLDHVTLGRLPRRQAGHEDRFLQSQFIKKRFVHENFTVIDNTLIRNDIALLKLKYPVTYTSRVRPACLPQSNKELTSPLLNCFISGYGRYWLNVTNKRPLSLNELKVTVLDTAECKHFWSYQVTNDHLCIFARLGKIASACSGDSGGPLMCQTLGEQFFVVGVANWVAVRCRNTAYPGVYAKVSSYLPWIRETVLDETGALPPELTG